MITSTNKFREIISSEIYSSQTYNGIVAKAQLITTLAHLLIKIIIRTNLHLQTQPNKKHYAEEQTQKSYKYQVRKSYHF